MPEPAAAMGLAGHVLATAVVGWLILHWCRQIGAVDRRLGWVVLTGVLARLALGAGLFWASYLDWPPLRGLHSADGFWELAPDARSYFVMAATAAYDGLGSIKAGSPSPTFVAVLAVWMRLVGATPTAAVLLNALLTAGACRLILSVPGATGPAARRAVWLLVTGLAWSPALVLFAAQGLKDQFVIAMLVVGAAGVFRWLQAWARQDLGPAIQGWALVAAAVLATAGIRAYVCAILIGALGLSVLLHALRLPRRPARLATAAVSIAALWIVFIVGAGAYYQPYGAMLARFVPASLLASLPQPAGALLTGGVPTSRVVVASLGDVVENARAGFVRTPGATNLAWPGEESGSRLIRLASGLAATFLPVTLLKAIGIVEFSGGRGLLAVTDLDAVVNLGLSLAIVVLVAREWRQLVGVPYFTYAVIVAVALTLPLAYTVTNFGTLFRLRLMAHSLIWLTALGLAALESRATSRVPART